MEGSIQLRAQERKTLLQVVKTANTHEQRLRAHVQSEHDPSGYDEERARETIAAEAYEAADS